MKTLNQFYDDALQRSLVEVPDDAGNETRTDLSGYAHGCSNDSVQGSTPTDYDGVALNNSPIGTRLVGKEGINHFHHGTAEPEMRGLYILLTIDNDGGMEVMRYAADLSRERPEIFQSAPVQLALQVYKVRYLRKCYFLFVTCHYDSHNFVRPRKSVITLDFSAFCDPRRPLTCLGASCSSTFLKCGS